MAKYVVLLVAGFFSFFHIALEGICQNNQVIFYIVRHGQTEWNVHHQGIYKNIPIDEVGKEQAIVLARKFQNVPFSVCFSSPLKRTYQTAAILAFPHGLKVITDRRLREVHSRANRETVLPLFLAFLYEKSLEYPQDKILVVTHSSIMKDLLSYLLELNCHKYKVVVYNTGYIELTRYGNRWTILNTEGVKLIRRLRIIPSCYESNKERPSVVNLKHASFPIIPSCKMPPAKR